MINTSKQDLRSTRKDPRSQAKSKHEDRNQAVRKIAKKRARRGDRTLDRTLEARPDVGPVARQTSDRTRGLDTGGNRPDIEMQHPIEYREVPGTRNYDRTRPVAGDRTLAVSDQWITAPTVGTTERVWSGRDQRPVSSRKAGFRPQQLLSQWGL